MAGHNKWSKIKRQKEKTDGQKSKIYGKFVRLISAEARRCGGDITSPGLKAVIDRAKAANVPADNIERAVKKFADGGAEMESIVYEAYGPGGCAMVIETLTDSRNRVSNEIKHILSLHGFSLAGIGSATWAFTHNPGEEWIPTMTVPLSDEDAEKLGKLIDDLEENDDVQDVYTNAE
ncbi:MAG: YebC/PmpR family DNA-binding transcriptional regulator [Patescibacteria group bacterium]